MFRRTKQISKVLFVSFLNLAITHTAISKADTVYTYDSKSRLKAAVESNLTTTVYEYDNAGNTLSKNVTPTAQLISFELNPFTKPLQINSSHDISVTGTFAGGLVADLPGDILTWGVRSRCVASISIDGVLTITGAGKTVVTASYGALTKSILIDTTAYQSAEHPLDTTAPSIIAPANVSTEQTSVAGTPVVLGAPTISDACDTSPTITNNAPALFPFGTSTVTWSATDDSGNSSMADQTVTIKSCNGTASGTGYYYTGLYKTQVSVTIDSANLAAGTLRYSNSQKRISIASTSIDSMDLPSHGEAIVKGKGAVNLIPGYTFTARITNAVPDRWEMTILDATGALYESGSGSLSRGDLIVTTASGCGY
jgi:hypothetical protein